MHPLVSDDLPKTLASDCIIIGGGSSLTLRDVSIADSISKTGRAYIIGINDAYRISSSLGMLYVADLAFAMHHKPAIDAAQAVQKFEKWTAGAELKKKLTDWKYIEGDGSVLDFSSNRKKVTLGQHSGFQTINIALLMGFKRIILMGFDCGTGPESNARHWFGDHPPGVAKSSPYESWRKSIERAANNIVSFDSEIINASRFSTLQCFQRQTIDKIYL